MKQVKKILMLVLIFTPSLVYTAGVRDHRTTNTVRDHRTTGTVQEPRSSKTGCDRKMPSNSRDHRNSGTVRDHRIEGKDQDCDGIDDNFENQLALKYAPEVRLAPSNKDWTRPANVDWYLAKVQLRYENKGACNKDDKIIATGKVNQQNLVRQVHRDKDMTFKGCKNKGTKRYSKSSTRFFLQPADKFHKGAPASQWKVYAHIKPSKAIRGGYDIQYWFFYAYNDAFASFNHEGDWEHITVSVDRNGNFVEAIYSQHEYYSRYLKRQLLFVNKTHPVVYSADGSHASYPKAGSNKIRRTPLSDHSYNGGPVWKTWRNLVNVGELKYPLNRQTFIQYGGLWGEIGETEYTSGPTGPAAKPQWNDR